MGDVKSPAGGREGVTHTNTTDPDPGVTKDYTRQRANMINVQQRTRYALCKTMSFPDPCFFGKFCQLKWPSEQQQLPR